MKIFLIYFLFITLFAGVLYPLVGYKYGTLISSVLATQSAIQEKGFPNTFNNFQTSDYKQIFNEDHSWIATVAAEKKRVIVATGDVIPARSVNKQVIGKSDFTWPYKYLANVLREADIAFINLETPLISECPVTDEGMVFCGDERHIEGLVFAGIDVANLANNHAGNWGVAGLKNTQELLKNNKIEVTGTKVFDIAIKNIRGLRFAFVGFNDIGSDQGEIMSANEMHILNTIKLTKNTADVIIAAFHWGTEYIDSPTERQRYLAKIAIDSGADLVVGNHPHWIQPVEYYNDKFIAYAHGNFIFDQMWSEKTRVGVIGKYTFYETKLIDVEFIPIKIYEYGQPNFMSALESKQILEEIQIKSEILQTQH